MNIGIFCSANHDIDRDFFTLTHEFGEWAAKEGHTIVYGGCNMGLILCGDFDANSILPLLERTFGRIPKGTPPTHPTSLHFREKFLNIL